jgi:hypothetical protein
MIDRGVLRRAQHERVLKNEILKQSRIGVRACHGEAIQSRDMVQDDKRNGGGHEVFVA